MQTKDHDLTPHIVDAVLDRTAGQAIRRFGKRVRATSLHKAALDLRSTRTVTSEGWATLVAVLRDLAFEGCDVTIVAGRQLQRLLHLTGAMQLAALVIVPEISSGR